MFSQVSEVAIICGSTECQYLKGTCLKKDAIIVNGKCSGFESKLKGVEKIPPHTMGSANYIEKKINELVDAVNKINQEGE